MSTREEAAGAEAATVEFLPVGSHLIRSRHVAQTFRVQVMQPGRRRGTRPRSPVVYFADGNPLFDMLMRIAYLMQLQDYNAAPFMLVGIGYPGDSPHAGARLRLRDLTFPGSPEIRMPPSSFEGVLTPEPGTKTFRGAEDFQAFIERELIPFIDEHYDTSVGDRTYFGHSMGGTFGLFTLFTRPHLFGNYIIGSPGLTYHGEAPGGVTYIDHEYVPDVARRFAEQDGALPRTRLYISVGTEEEYEPVLRNWRLTSSFYRMTALLRQLSIPGLDLMTEVLPGETHATTVPIAFMHGIRAMFGRRAP